MATEAPVAPAGEPAGATRSRRRPSGARVAEIALALLPGAVVVYFAFNDGGFFPGAVGFLAILLIQLLIVRLLVARRPFEGYGRAFIAVGLVLAAFAGWVLLSGVWAHALDRTLMEFDRAFMYLLVFALAGSFARNTTTIQWVARWLALGMLVVCTCALITRVLPHVWHTSPNFVNNRLSFPLTYWNALGIIAGCGLLVAIGLTTTLREPLAVRAASAAATPVFAVTLLFTFSRGAIVATIVGAVVLVILSRSPGLVGGLLSSLPFVTIALLVAYHADQLATLQPDTPRGVSQGKDVAIATLVCIVGAAATRVALRPLDRRLAAIRLSQRARDVRRWGFIGFAAFAVVVALAAGAPSWVSDEYHKFTTNKATSITDLRSRLTDPSSNGRAEHWRVALDGFADQPLRGNGAGTYQFLWERHRKLIFPVVDGHGLYFEAGAELGVVGLLLLVGTIVAILVGLLRRARGPNRSIYITLFAASLAWAVHAGVDWDWEMPATTAWVFGVGGVALARRRRAEPGPPWGDRARIPLALALLVTAATPALLLFSQSRLGAAASAFVDRDCTATQKHALDSIGVIGVRPEPYQMLGYCDIQQGHAGEAVAAMRKAVDAEPNSWEYRYGLALALAAGGNDPRPELRRSLAVNPGEPLTKDAVRILGGGNPRTWPKLAQQRVQATIDSGRLTLR
jgi:O-antigen ligase